MSVPGVTRLVFTGVGGKGSCGGDSGGPVTRTGTNQVIGVVSFGGRTCVGEATPYSYQARVSSSYNWIQSATNQCQTQASAQQTVASEAMILVLALYQALLYYRTPLTLDR